MKDELGGKSMTEFVTLRPNTCSNLIVDGSSDTKSVTKRRLKFNDYKNCLLNNKIILKSQERFKSEANNMFKEYANKIALSSSDDRRLQTFDRMTSHPYGKTAGKVSKTELLEYLKNK